MSPPEAADAATQWRWLDAECELLRGAAEKAWRNVAIIGVADPAAASMQAALIHYQAAISQQRIAERALLVYLQAKQADALLSAQRGPVTDGG
jgi:hypothetical protein